MNKVLLVTDHVFIKHDENIYDNFIFNNEFFIDYLDVFDSIYLAARYSTYGFNHNSQLLNIKNIEIVDLKSDQGVKRLFNQSRIKHTLEKVLQKIDVVIIRIPSIFGIIAAELSAKHNIKYLFEFIGDPDDMYLYSNGVIKKNLLKPYSKHLKKVYTKIISNSFGGSFVSKLLKEKYVISPGNYHVISSIRLKKESILEPKDIFKDELCLITIGSLQPIKGHDLLIKALSVLRKKDHRISLKIIGEGPDRSRLEGIIHDLNMIEYVNLTGHVSSRVEINRFLHESDLFVLASLSEGMPRVILEAMSQGLPCIGSRVGGIPEILTKDQIFDSGNYLSIACKLEEILNNRKLLLKYAKHSNVVVNLYTIEKLSSMRQELYKSLII